MALVDAPVSGARPKAIDGTLTIMLGGDDEAAIEKATPVIETMSANIFRTGPLGSGHAMKALNNYVGGAAFVATCEALVAGTKFGLDPAVMVDILNVSTGRNFTTMMAAPNDILPADVLLRLLARAVHEGHRDRGGPRRRARRSTRRSRGSCTSGCAARWSSSTRSSTTRWR